MAEFTGERVVPGEVDVDLWNEHAARYAFAARLCRLKRVADIGCGTGYGALELAKAARGVVAVDISEDAISHGQAHFARPNICYVRGSATALPLADASIDLVVAFEIIEHLDDWPAMLREARRVLTPSGQFIVSTPNKSFYAESRRQSGANPYHVHEFDFDELRAVLGNLFPHVSMFVQNHSPSIVLQPVRAATGAEVRIEAGEINPEESSFFLAVCAGASQTGAPAFVHVPSGGNVLRERSQHILKLEEELATKDTWLMEAKASHEELLAKFRALEEELEERNRWANRLDAELDEARRQIDAMHARKDAEIAEVSSGYEKKVASLERECETQSRWAMETQQELNAKQQELAQCVDQLHETERTVEERTTWAQRLDAELEQLRAKLAFVESSRWVRLGSAIGVGPGPRLK